MKINVNRLPFTKKSCLLMLFFACMFVFASFTKEDRQKVRTFKVNLLSKFKEDKKDSLTGNSRRELPQNSIQDKSNAGVQHSESDNINRFNRIEYEFPLVNKENSLNIYSYPSKEKEGIIGTFSEKEKDRISDNFFTVDIPEINKDHATAYLEYELFGLSSHESVSRSINNNVAIGGEIIVPNSEWSHQKEALNTDLIRSGKNNILFTSPAAGVKYKIKNLKIVFEKNKKNSNLIVSSLLSVDQLYIKGSNSNSANININNESITVHRGEFEKIIQLSENDKSKGVFSITVNGTASHYKIPGSSKAFKIINENYNNTKSIGISNDVELETDYEGAHITIEKETSESANLEVLKLRGKDFPATSQGIKNVTLQGSAYRLSLVSGKLNKKVKLKIPYDEKRLGLISAKEIKTFYFDYDQKQWKIEQTAVVDEKTKTVTIESNGDNDYINGIISVPESPQTNAFNPTSISGLKAGDPASRMQFMSTPTANQQGSASISYPIEIPSGRNGMQPNIAVTYNSNGGNGWMGEGWDISGVSAITLDTRWGTPTFDPSNESEIYLLDGEMLIYDGDYLPHRHNSSSPDGTFDTTKQPRNGSGIKKFYLRKNNNFLRIERYGNNPTNYRWVITETNGTKKYYGGNETAINENAILKRNDNKIVHWGIRKEIDVHSNNIKYEYDNVLYNSFSGEDSNLNGGKNIHIKTITYSGKNDDDGLYKILFNMETLQPPSSPLPFRQDLIIDAKLGIKRIDPRRLISIDTQYDKSIIKNYEFNYTWGEFFKSLLASITTDGVRYQLDYYKDTTTSLFSKDTEVSAPATEAFSGAINAALTPSRINSNHTLEWGWGTRIGVGFGLFIPHSSGDKNFMVTGFTGESYPENKGANELIDFNGDGIPDILYRKRNGDNGLKFYPGSVDGIGNFYLNDPIREVHNLRSNFTQTKGSTFNAGGTALFNWWKMGFDFTKSWSESESTTSSYIIDANSDGLPDVVNDGVVWFNKINDSGDSEMLTTSEATENMVIKGNNPMPYTEPADIDGDGSEEPVKGKNDVVKVWIAPKSGYIKITDRIIIDDTDADALAVYSIETRNPNNLPKNGRLYLTTLTTGVLKSINIEHYNDYPNTPLGINKSERIYVESGEKVFFRLHKKTGKNYVVSTSPLVQYVYSNGVPIDDVMEEEQDGFMPNSLRYEENYFLNNLTRTKKVEQHTFISIPSFIIPKLTDDVTYSIIRTKEIMTNPATDIVTVYTRKYPANTVHPTTVQDVNVNFPALPTDRWNLKFIVKSDSYMDKSIEWKNIKVNPNGSPNDVFYDNAAYPSYYIKNFNQKYDLKAAQNLPAGSSEYFISLNKNITFTPSQAGQFTYIIKKNGEVLGKRVVKVSTTGITETLIDGTPVSGIDPISFYNGDPSLGIAVNDMLNILVYCETYFDRLAYEGLKNQLNNGIFNIYHSTNHTFLESTVETSLNTGEFSGVSAVYHNWGQFIYNQNKDVKPGTPTTVPTDPKYWDLQTGPSTVTGPEYVINPDTPKDEYGMLINNNFMDAPFSQMSYNFSACDATFPPNSQEYNDCIGDTLQATYQAAASNIVSAFTPIVPMIVYNKKDENGVRVEKWHGHMFPEQYSLPSSFRDEEVPEPFFVSDDPDEPNIIVPGNLNTQMFAIEKKQKSKSKTTNWGLGIPVISQSTSQLTGYGNINTQDFFDVNGDGYPDMLYRTQSQLSNSLGGLKGGTAGSVEGGDAVTSSSDSFQKANTLAFTPTAIKTVGRTLGIIKSDAKADSSSPWSGGLGFTNYPDSYDKGLKYWIDVNGDGLVDKVEMVNDELKYKLNYGSGLVNGAFESFNGLATNNSSPVGATNVSIGGGLGAMLSSTSTMSMGFGVSGGLSGGASTGTSKKMFVDINGDGLVDIVTVDGGYSYVSYNIGNKFLGSQSMIKATNSILGAPVNMSNEVRNFNGALNLGVGLWANIPLITFFGATILYFRVGLDATGNIGTSVSEVNKSFKDMNGDGFPDLVTNTGGGFTINYSKIGRTNKLAKVTEKTTNGTFSIDYGFTKPNYSDPHSRLVMTEVKVFNPHVDHEKYTMSTNGKNLITQFTYEQSKYDRRERSNYGFSKVITKEIIGSSVESKTVEAFHNTTLFNYGIPKYTEIYKGDGNVLASKTENAYKLYKYINSYTQIQEIPSSQFDTYDTGGTEGRKMALILPSGNTKTVYEEGGSITTHDYMYYNDKAQLIDFKHLSNEPTGNYSAHISYHDNASLSAKNILNIPLGIKVLDPSDDILRDRRTEVDYSTGDITKVKVVLNATEIAETTMTYTPDGNIKTITYPDDYALTYVYDPLGKYVSSVTDNFGLSSSSVYNPHWDVLLSSTDVTGNVITYTYDGRGRITSILAPKEVGVSPYTVKYSYFLAPRTIDSITFNLLGSVTENYDYFNPTNPIETISFADFTGEVVQVKKDIEMPEGEKMSVSGIVLKDQLLRPVQQFHPLYEDKSTVLNRKYLFDQSAHFTTTEYDQLDRITNTIDENGSSTKTIYDIDGSHYVKTVKQMQNGAVELKSIILSDAEGKQIATKNIVNNEELTTSYEYNIAGDLLRVIDPEEIETTYEYDFGGRRIVENHPDHGSSTFKYDLGGHLIQRATANTVSSGLPDLYINYEYNKNRLMRIHYPNLIDGSSNPSNVEYVYGVTGNDTGRLKFKQDGTGVSTYFYGSMGEITQETRRVIGVNVPMMTFATSYQYDSFNRLKEMNYPDGEDVFYTYGTGGNLKSMVSTAYGEYIKNIEYDGYEQRTKVLYGNDTYSTFQYKPKTRMLDRHELKKDNYANYFDNNYNYDLVGNILTINNVGFATPNMLGGTYTMMYGYDELNRLILSSGNFNGNTKADPAQLGDLIGSYETRLTYRKASGIDTKIQTHTVNGNIKPENTYQNSYTYIDKSHKLNEALDSSTGLIDSFEYDANGNPTSHSDYYGNKNMFWDEEDNMKAYFSDDSGVYQYNSYDHTGERTIKYTLNASSSLYQNGVLVDPGAMVLSGYKVYPNPYIVVSSDNKYTKHYYEGQQRVASRLIENPGGIFNRTAPTPIPGGKEDADTEKDFKNYAFKAGLDTTAIETEFSALLPMQDGLYYLHGDHLGTATYVTDEVGLPTQFFLNLPFGETFAEQQIIGKYINPYKFNAKELDSETGFYYYGARYYNPRLSVWYGVDPLAIWNPVKESQFYGDGQHNEGVYYWGNLNPYIYTYQSPVNYIDPNGKQSKSNAHRGNRGIGIPIPMYEKDGIITPFPRHSQQEYREGFDKLKNDAKTAAVVAAVAVSILTKDIWGPIADIVSNDKDKTNNSNNDKDAKPIPKSPKGKGSVPKEQRDKKRVWTKNERSKMLENQEGKCAQCGEGKTVDEVDAHHKKRHADGGKTDDENGAAVCKPCHKDIHR